MNRWPINKAHFWETAPFFRVLLPLVFGIAYARYHAFIFSITYLLLFIFISALSYSLLSLKKRSPTALTICRFILLNITVFFIGWALYYCSDVRNDTAWFAKQLEHNQAYAARITDAPVEKERTWKLPVSIVSTIQTSGITKASGKAFLYLYKDEGRLPFQKGDTILIPNKWQPIKNPGNPFEFDYAAYCAQNNLYYQQFLASKDVTLYANGADKDISTTEHAHNWCMNQLDHYIKDSSTKGLIQAMLIGDEVNLDEHLRQAYSDTGIVHIIAISGANVTIFFIVISYLLFFIRHKKYRWVKYLVALPLVWFYVVMAGAAPSAIRAATMFSILAIGLAFQKNNNSLNHLFATAFLLLCAVPAWLFSLGFQLSFLAVLSIIIFYGPVYRLIKTKYWAQRVLWQTIAASIAAEVLVAPLIIYYFHLFPLFFIVSNVAAFLFMGVVLVLGMLVVVFSFIPVIATFCAVVCTWLVQHFNVLVYHLQDLNPSSFHFLSLSILQLVALYIFIAGLAVFLLKKINAALLIGIAGLCLLLSLLCGDEWTALCQNRLVVYNINHTNQVEHISGKYFSVLHTDTTLSADKKNYTLKPAHTAWHAWRQASAAQDAEIWQIGNKRVLLLSTAPQNTSYHFPIDYIIINYTASYIDLKLLKNTFSPKMIILDSNLSRKMLDKWADAAHEANIPLHRTAVNGAFILNAL